MTKCLVIPNPGVRYPTYPASTERIPTDGIVVEETGYYRYLAGEGLAKLVYDEARIKAAEARLAPKAEPKPDEKPKGK